MIKAVIRSALVAALAVGVLGFTQTVRAADTNAPHKAVAKAADAPKTSTMSGDIESVDVKAGTVTIKNKKSTKTFVVNADTDFGGTGKNTTIADLKVGDKVNVHFKPDTTPLVATKIGHVDAKPKAKKAE
ncbi:MAG: DUF5666 domain-containing protein [Verrucomicrobiota bacterium]